MIAAAVPAATAAAALIIDLLVRVRLCWFWDPISAVRGGRIIIGSVSKIRAPTAPERHTQYRPRGLLLLRGGGVAGEIFVSAMYM